MNTYIIASIKAAYSPRQLRAVFNKEKIVAKSISEVFKKSKSTDKKADKDDKKKTGSAMMNFIAKCKKGDGDKD